MLRRIPVAPFDRRLEERRRDRDPRRFRRSVLARRAADAHQRRTGVAHDRPDVGEVQVHEAGLRDQVGDPLHALSEDVVRHPERLDDRGLTLDDLQQPVVLDHDQRVDAVAQLVDAALSLIGALAAFEGERPRDDSDRQCAELLPELRDYRRAAGPRAASFSGGDEDHVSALERLFELVAALLCGGESDLGISTGAESACHLRADLNLHVGVSHHQRLRIGVHGDELDTRPDRRPPCG